MNLEFNTPSYNYYSNGETNSLIAVERTVSKAIGKAFKKYKKANLIPDTEIVVGYNFVLDEEYKTLKIDFEEELTFKIKNLEKADISK